MRWFDQLVGLHVVCLEQVDADHDPARTRILTQAGQAVAQAQACAQQPCGLECWLSLDAQQAGRAFTCRTGGLLRVAHEEGFVHPAVLMHQLYSTQLS